MKYISLARVSTVKQGEGHSLEVQFETNQRFAERQGWTLYKQLSDMVSGANSAYDERVGLHQAIDHLKKGEADVLVVYDASRVARQDEAFGRFLSDVFDSGGKLAVSSQGQVYNNKLEAQELLHWVKAVATYEWLQIAKRTQLGKKAALERGGFIWPPPFGYTTKSAKADDGSNIKVIAIDPLQADMVTRICERFIAGDTKTSIVQEINDWSKKNKANYQFSLASLAKLIKRLHWYAGGTDTRTITLLGEEITTEVKFPRIISEETLAAVRKSDIFRADRGATNEITVPYKPIASCICGENIQVSHTRTLKDGSKARHYYCSSLAREKGRQQTNRDLIDEPTECRYRVSSTHIDKVVLAFLKDVMKSPDSAFTFEYALDYLRANVEIMYPRAIKGYTESIERKQGEYDDLVEKVLSSDNFGAIAEAINARLEKLKKEIDEDKGMLDKLESNLPRLEAILDYYQGDSRSAEETKEAVADAIKAINNNDDELANDLLYELGIKIQLDFTKTPVRNHIRVWLDYPRLLDTLVDPDELSEDFRISDRYEAAGSQQMKSIPLLSMVINYSKPKLPNAVL